MFNVFDINVIIKIEKISRMGTCKNTSAFNIIMLKLI